VSRAGLKSSKARRGKDLRGRCAILNFPSSSIRTCHSFHGVRDLFKVSSRALSLDLFILHLQSEGGSFAQVLQAARDEHFYGCFAFLSASPASRFVNPPKKHNEMASARSGLICLRAWGDRFEDQAPVTNWSLRVRKRILQFFIQPDLGPGTAEEHRFLADRDPQDPGGKGPGTAEGANALQCGHEGLGRQILRVVPVPRVAM